MEAASDEAANPRSLETATASFLDDVFRVRSHASTLSSADRASRASGIGSGFMGGSKAGAPTHCVGAITRSGERVFLVNASLLEQDDVSGGTR